MVQDCTAYTPLGSVSNDLPCHVSVPVRLRAATGFIHAPPMSKYRYNMFPSAKRPFDVWAPCQCKPVATMPQYACLMSVVGAMLVDQESASVPTF